ncbi:uncharacterized protein PV09_03589 [Verruconis gallopava]|uniref:SET domain-containing protein n=1 Tax=Verruconis gallopava TaxID=253628 RepID=A0A0D1YYE5_9PEZI|nr:uncharacterized protein PV09_03589 [Verruconis gallopava]KIW05732.1 hypothetical protein PV09_03589 [Verruconis gallopava]
MMKIQFSLCCLALFSPCLAVQSLLDIGYDFCASNALFSSINPLCAKPQTANVQLPIIHGSASKPEEVLKSSRYDHHHHEDQIGRQSLWSTSPRCLAHYNETTKYCVYTSQSFAANRGISIFANSDHSDKYARLQGLSDPAVVEGCNAETDPRFTSQPIPGKGLGLVASRPISRGEELFRSTPVVIIEEGLDELFDESDRLPFYHLAIKQLPDGSRRLFHDLMGHFGGDVVEDIINTNCFAVALHVGADDDEAVAATAVFPEMSRMNHDCRPNAHYYFDPDTLTQHVHALRTILPGEEITVSYINPAQVSAHRKEALRSSWGFSCGCNACTAHAPIREASDRRVEEIERLQSMLGDYSAASPIADSETGTRVADLLIELYRLEGMLGPISEAYAYAALEYNSAQRKWEAIKYANMAIEAGLLYGGPKDGDVQSMMELVRSPEEHWSWDYRARVRWQEG